MFCPEDILLEHGLVGAFDSMAMMHDEELAIIVEDSSAERGYSEHGSSLVREMQGLTYIEVQMASQELAAHLFHRFGVRRGDPVAIICHGHSAAEVKSTLFWMIMINLICSLALLMDCLFLQFIACLACARIGAPFVPVDSSWIFSQNGEKLAQIVSDARPVAAVVVAGDGPITFILSVIYSMRSCRNNFSVLSSS